MGEFEVFLEGDFGAGGPFEFELLVGVPVRVLPDLPDLPGFINLAEEGCEGTDILNPPISDIILTLININIYRTLS